MWYSHNVTEPPEEKFWWVVLFRPTSIKPYNYLRTVSEMIEELAKQKKKEGSYPYRVWRIKDGEAEKVEIND